MEPTTALLVNDKHSEWKAVQADYSSDRLLHQLFEQQAVKTPEAPALISEDRTLSYRQLDRESDALSCRLQAAGARPSGLVALFSERSPERSRRSQRELRER
jgi:non-ribosomal peptide synthetase component F